MSSPSSEERVERPTRQDFGVAIELLKRHGMAGIETAVFHGMGPKTDNAFAAVEAVTRMVAWLREARDDHDEMERLIRAAAPFVNAVAVMADDRRPALAWLADAAIALDTLPDESRS